MSANNKDEGDSKEIDTINKYFSKFTPVNKNNNDLDFRKTHQIL